MSDTDKSIHDFDVNLICGYFAGLDRQGPGSPDATVKALSFIDNLTDESRIVDLGCGTGGQTMVLAQHAPGSVTGIDVFPTFIELFNRNAERAGLQDRVKGVVGSMDNLPYQEGELDLIWSEGSIYNIGFERGINEWRKLLKDGGYIAVSEASWFTEERPAEIEDFWMAAYQEIDTIPNKVMQMQKAGYVPTATFVLPECCWIENYHAPQVSLQEAFLAKNPGNEAAAGFVGFQRLEAEMYRKYRQYYGYAFYIGKKIA